MRTSLRVLGGLCLVMGFAGAARATEFSDTTTGNVQEKGGLPGDAAMTKRGQDIMKKFKDGRLSSAKATNSRFSGLLEMHDANLDGITDHDVGDSKDGLEGNMTKLLSPGQNLKKRAIESQRQANKKWCGSEEGTWEITTIHGQTKVVKTLAETVAPDVRHVQRACFSPSGIIVDTGAAHAGEEHRKLRVSKEAAEAAGNVGKSYGGRTIADIQRLMQEAYKLPAGQKVAAIDQLRSEVAWLEEQKKSNYERSWKSLRAARLAGYDTADGSERGTSLATVFDTDRKTVKGGEETDGAEFMHDIDLKLSKGATDQDIAQKIALEATIKTQPVLRTGNDWNKDVTIETTGTPQADIDAADREEGRLTGNDLNDPIKHHRMNLAEWKRRFSSTAPAGVRIALEEQAKTAILNSTFKDPNTKKDFQKRVDDIAKCMNKDTWCYNQDAASKMNANNPQADPTKGVQEFDVAKGDPGNAFIDTRELVYMKFAEAQDAPIDKIEGIVTSADFNRKTDKEYFEELDKRRAAAAEMQQDTEASGSKAYNSKTQSFQEFSGIRQGLNDTYREQGTEQIAVGSGYQAGAGGGPVGPASVNAPGTVVNTPTSNSGFPGMQ